MKTRLYRETNLCLVGACTDFVHALTLEHMDAVHAYRSLLDRLLVCLQASGLAIMLNDPGVGALQITASAGLSEQYVQFGNQQLAGTELETRRLSPAYQAFEQRRSLYLSGFLEDPSHPFHYLARLTRSNTFYIAPIAVGFHCSGVLTLYHPDVTELDRDDILVWVSFVAQQLALSENVLARKRIEGALAQHASQLEESNERLNRLSLHQREFLSIVSHELRTPMVAIRNAAHILPMQGLLSPGQAEMVEVVNQQSSRGLALIDDLLDLAKIEQGQLTITPRPFALDTLVADTLRAVTALSYQKDLRMTIQTPEIRVMADEQRIAQVLSNFLTNAIKFTPPGGHVAVRVSREGRDVRVAVTDTGVGISPEDLPRLFNKYERVSSEAHGNGLGLAISRAIVELHGGQIGVNSRAGKGSTFWFKIPLDHPLSKEP